MAGGEIQQLSCPTPQKAARAGSRPFPGSEREPPGRGERAVRVTSARRDRRPRRGPAPPRPPPGGASGRDRPPMARRRRSPRGRVIPGTGTAAALGPGRPALQRPVRGHRPPGPAPPAAPVLTRHPGQVGVRVAEPAGAEEAAEPGALGVPAALHGGPAPAALATTNGCRKAPP